MLPHLYIDANDDPAAHAADLTRRQAAQAGWIIRTWPDEAQVWHYDSAAATAGADPWQPVSVRPGADGRCTLTDPTGNARDIAPDSRLFVELRDRPAHMLPPAGPPVDLTQTRTLICMDRPLLVSAHDADGYSYIAVVAEEALDGTDIFMAARVTRTALDKLEANRLPLRDLFTDQRHGALLSGRFDDRERGLFVHRSDPLESELPEPGILLERE